MKVSVVIPNYNGETLLKENISFVVKALSYYEEKTNLKTEIIVVDDGSKDGSVAVLKEIEKESEKANKRFSFLVHHHNVGFSSTVNDGVKKALGEIVVLLNTDVRPEKNFLPPLLSHFVDDPMVFAVGCMDKSIENGKTALRGRGVGKFERGFLLHGKGEPVSSKTLWASGGSSAFRKSIWENIGGMDTRFNPFYWEDIDLSYRALKLGYSVLFEKESVVIHEHGKGAIRQGNSKKQISKVAYRNQFLFVWKNITDASYLFQHFIYLPIHLVTACVKGNITFLSGFISAVQQLPSLLVTRKKQNVAIVKSDKEILREVES